MNIFVFDIETIPDAENGKKLFNLEHLSDEDAVLALERLRQTTHNSKMLPLHLQKIVAISVVLRTNNTLKVWTLGQEDASEKEIIERFFAGLDRYEPQLVTWNGSGFDLPVLHYRAMLHGIASSSYWEIGDRDSSYKWNNYLSRFHQRHLDLMDVLAGYQNRAYAPLDGMSTLLGFPGKMGMHGSEVYKEYMAGNIRGIRDYCETDVLNTYLVYLRFQLIRAKLNPDDYAKECKTLKDYLHTENKPHLLEFLQEWNNNEKEKQTP